MLNQALSAIGLSAKVDVQHVPTLSLNACYVLQELQTQKKLFLKILSEARSSDDRLQELNVQKLASTAQLSPVLLQSHHDAHMTWMLLDYIPSDVVSLQQMVACLRAFHQLPVDSRIKAVDPLMFAQRYLLDALKIKADSLPLQRLQKSLQRLKLPQVQHYSLCHLDVHPGNFLQHDDQIFIIDFENSGVFDPLYDLAVLGFYQAFDETQFEHLLRLYMPSQGHALQKILQYQKICLHLFLCFLAHRLLLQHLDLPEAIHPNLEQFSKLIQQYWQNKNPDAQLQLECDLFRFGLGLIGF